MVLPVGKQCVIVVFPDHTHLLFDNVSLSNCINARNYGFYILVTVVTTTVMKICLTVKLYIPMSITLIKMMFVNFKWILLLLLYPVE